MLLKTNVKRTRILGVILLPAAAVKQKAKEGLVVLGGALFYPLVKRSPCTFGFCVRLVCAGCLRGKKGLLFLLAFKRKRIQGILMIYPLIAAGWLFTFSWMKK
jgi:hypothetical protein